MVKWTSGGSERPFNQSAANGRNEPTLRFAAVPRMSVSALLKMNRLSYHQLAID